MRVCISFCVYEGKGGRWRGLYIRTRRERIYASMCRAFTGSMHLLGWNGYPSVTGWNAAFAHCGIQRKRGGGVRHPLGIQLDRASPNLTIFVSLLGSSSFFAFWMPTTISGACTLIPSLQRLWGECRCFSFLRLHMLRGDSSLGRQPAVVLRTTQWCTPLQKV